MILKMITRNLDYKSFFLHCTMQCLVVECQLSCSAVCRTDSPGQGWNPCPVGRQILNHRTTRVVTGVQIWAVKMLPGCKSWLMTFDYGSTEVIFSVFCTFCCSKQFLYCIYIYFFIEKVLSTQKLYSTFLK